MGQSHIVLRRLRAAAREETSGGDFCQQIRGALEHHEMQGIVLSQTSWDYSSDYMGFYHYHYYIMDIGDNRDEESTHVFFRWGLIRHSLEIIAG